MGDAQEHVGVDLGSEIRGRRVEIDESEMLKFLLEHEKSFSVLIERFKQKINDYEKN